MLVSRNKRSLCEHFNGNLFKQSNYEMAFMFADPIIREDIRNPG